MTRVQFEQLSIAEQLRCINQFGIFLTARTNGTNRIYLYGISSFYIELLHDLYDGISLFRIFDEERYLNVYLDKIDISEVYL